MNVVIHSGIIYPTVEGDTIVRIVQEIYDENGKLTSIHQKYPEDTGHIDIVESEE